MKSSVLFLTSLCCFSLGTQAFSNHTCSSSGDSITCSVQTCSDLSSVISRINNTAASETSTISLLTTPLEISCTLPTIEQPGTLTITSGISGSNATLASTSDYSITINTPSTASTTFDSTITLEALVSMQGGTCNIEGILIDADFAVGGGTCNLNSSISGSVELTINGSSAIVNVTGTSKPSDSETPGNTFQISNGTLSLSGASYTSWEAYNTTYPFTIQNQYPQLSGTIGSQYQTATNPTLTITSSDQINMYSGYYLILSVGTLNTTETMTISSSPIIGPSLTLNATSGTTLTLNSVNIATDLLNITTATSSANLTLGSSGSYCIPIFNFTQSNITETVSGILGGSSGLTTSAIYNETQYTGTTLALNSANTYTGITTIGNGTTLQINNGGSFGTVVNTDTAIISSGGTLSVLSEGSFGNSNYSVNINSGGTLSIASGGTATGYGGSDSVSPYYGFFNYGTIMGCGTLNGTVTNNAVTTTGCSCSILNVNGSFTSQPGSSIEVFLQPGCTSGLNISENLVLNSDVTLQINPEPGCYSRKAEDYEIIKAGSLSGTFEQVFIESVLLKQTLTYSPTSVTLTITPEPLSNVVSSGNSENVAKALDAVLDTGHAGLCNIVGDFIPLTASEISAALDKMQPAQFKAFAVAQENNAVKVIDTLGFRFQRELDAMHCKGTFKTGDGTKKESCNVEAKPFHAWVGGFGDNLHQNNVVFAGSPQVGYQENMGGISTGMDYHFAKYLYVGALGAYTDSNIKWQNNRGKGSIQTGYAGLYFSALGKIFYGNASVLGGWSHYDAHRNINLPEKNFKAKSNHGGSQILSHIDTGVNLGWEGFTLRPFDSFDYISQTEQAFTETGAEDLNLSVQKNNSILLRNELGLNFAGCFCIKGTEWTLSPKISWVREVRVKGAEYTSTFAGTDEDFTVTGFFPDRSLVSPGVSLTGNMLNDLLTIGLYYNGEFKGNYSDHSYGGQIRFGF